MTYNYDKEELVTNLHASFLYFLQFFYRLVNNRPFIVPQPVGRESHVISMCRQVVDVVRNPAQRHRMHVPPGYGKSTMAAYGTSWAQARYPFSNVIYTSYSKTIASKHTALIRRIIGLPEYRELFGVEIRNDSRGKEMFTTNFGGVIAAAGIQGAITGLDCGLPDLDTYSGMLIIDDCHKPDEVHSDTIREGVIRNYCETLEQRLRGKNVPIFVIAQRLHEMDLPGFLANGGDGRVWGSTVLKALDDAGNALWPEKDTVESLLIKQKTDPYTFSSQYQQDPLPAGGALFKREDFAIIDYEPEILKTFITVDTAETMTAYADYTVMSFWGYYRIKEHGVYTGQFGLHWIDCRQIKIEPRYLKDEFMSFWQKCMQFKVQPDFAAIERKSAGVTLVNILSEFRGMRIHGIERSRASGSKGDRFISMQPYIGKKCISFSEGAEHAEMCIDHMVKITPNNTHAHDDICDTAYDAVKLALIDKSIYVKDEREIQDSQRFTNQIYQRKAARGGLYGY